MRDAGAEPAVELNEANVRLRMREALAYIYEEQIVEYQTNKPTPYVEPEHGKKQEGFRIRGEWPSWVRGSVLPDNTVSAIYDSNAFVTLFVLYPLFLLDESGLPAPARKIAEMKDLAMRMFAPGKDDRIGDRRACNGGQPVAPGTFCDYQIVNKAGEVNFWPVYEDFHGPVQIAERLPFGRLLGPIFDIQNDTDDTAVFYMTALKFDKEQPGAVKWQVPPKDVSKIFTPGPKSGMYLDEHRVRADHREEKWKPEPTQAYMTWLSNEDVPGNKQPIHFYLANNVDCVVIANALYALGLNERLNDVKREIPGYHGSCDLAKKVLFEETYPGCGLYYPAKWLFPYVYSRALRDGGNECLAEKTSGKDPVKFMVERIMRPGDANSGDYDPTDGSWGEPPNSQADVPADRDTVNPEFRGDPRVYATALNLITLHNLGATKWGDARIDEAMQKGMTYLINHGYRSERAPTRGKEAGRYWQGGVFFTSSVQQVARWKARAYTTAVVYEAMAKYLMDYGDKAKTDARFKLTCDDVPGWCQ